MIPTICWRSIFFFVKHICSGMINNKKPPLLISIVDGANIATAEYRKKVDTNPKKAGNIIQSLFIYFFKKLFF